MKIMTSPTCSYFNWPIYGLSQDEKSTLLAEHLNQLTKYQIRNCRPYARIMNANDYDVNQSHSLEDIPFIPVRLFKEYRLASISDDLVFKTLTSSGTTSQQVSKIVLDRETAKLQTKALVFILQHYIGKSRLPMLIIDHPNVIENRQSFSARSAGILGISNFGRNHTYALNEDMSPNIETIYSFLEQHRGERILLFGFTFMVWKYFFQAMKDLPNPPQFQEAILIHSGGWKKLLEEEVNNDTFKSSLQEAFRIMVIHNFYGMVEQAGSIFMECEYGHFHAPVFADILIRDARDWSVLHSGKKGLIQVLSTLPISYPGHSLLTEDIGEIIGIDDCPCGRKGKAFRVHGRIAKAEIRGCSDVHALETD